MSYDLDLFRGDIDDGEESWAPLDPVVARALVGELAGATFARDEWYWPVGALTVSLLLTAGEGKALRSIGVGVNVTGAATADDLRRDYRQALAALLGLADRLGARLFDHQLDDYVEPSATEIAVASFA